MSIAFLFPGQGSQTVGMGKSLYDNVAESKAIFDKAANIASSAATPAGRKLGEKEMCVF